MGIFTKKKRNDIAATVFRDKDPKRWTLLAHGKSGKRSDLKPKTISRDEGLRIKKKYKMEVHRDQYGSYGYKGKVPKKIF